MSRLNHPNVLRFYGLVVNGPLVVGIMTEFAKNGSLASYLRWVGGWVGAGVGIGIGFSGWGCTVPACECVDMGGVVFFTAECGVRMMEASFRA